MSIEESNLGRPHKAFARGVLAEKPLVVCFDDADEILAAHSFALQAKKFTPNCIQIDGGETRKELEEIVDDAFAKNPAAIITDFSMNGITGKNILDLYRAHFKGVENPPPLILYTGEHDLVGSSAGTPSEKARDMGFERVFDKAGAKAMYAEIARLTEKANPLPPQ